MRYGESTTSFSNFKGLETHRKNAGLFIHCDVVAMSTRTIANFPLFCFLQKCRFLHKKMEGSTWGDSQAPQTKLIVWSFFLFIMAIWIFFWQLWPTSCRVGVCFWPNLKSTKRLKFKSTCLEWTCSDTNKTPTTCVELKGKLFPAHRIFAETEPVLVSCLMFMH